MADFTNAELNDDYTDDTLQGDSQGARSATGNTEDDNDGNYLGDPEEEEEEEKQPTETGDPLVDIYTGLGFEEGRLLFDDQETSFADLTAEQRQEVITDRLAAERQAGFEEAETALGLTNEEKQILNHYREHGTLEGVEISAAPSIAAMTHDDLHRASIRVLLGADASEQDVNASLESRRASTTFIREAEAIRAQLGQQQQVQQTQQATEQYNTYVGEIQQAASAIKSIGGLQLKPEHLEYVVDQLTKIEGDSAAAPFIAALANPLQLTEYAAKALLFDSMVEGFQNMLSNVQQPTQQQRQARSATEIVQSITGAAPAGRDQRQNQALTNEDLDNPFA